MFFAQDLLSKMLISTNEKLNLHLSSLSGATKNKYIYPITFLQLQAFIGLIILTGVFRVHREPISNLYSDDPNLCRPIFRATLPREKFKVIFRFLRFDDYRTRLERIKTDRLAPIREVFEEVIHKLKTSYIPNKFIAVDEHLC